jgi:hypothetical protein
MIVSFHIRPPSRNPVDEERCRQAEVFRTGAR